jgi:hypothetical protein
MLFCIYFNAFDNLFENVINCLNVKLIMEPFSSSYIIAIFYIKKIK